ncbi:hypothetical protein pb186bvf_010501 [Paramecium bursaria]
MIEFHKGDIINDEYEIIKLLSQGSFGKVYKGKSINRQCKVAIKIEKIEMSSYQSLDREIDILTTLRGVSQIPQLIWHGKIGDNQRVMVINLLGRDLCYYLKKHKQFSHECLCNIGSQMITILEQIHKKNIIHRDLKPENILSSPSSDKIYLIDFGISKNLESNKRPKDKIPFMGTSRYASIAAHQGQEQSKKDDLESLGYVLIYLWQQNLPWQNVDNKKDPNRLEKIGLLKQQITPEELCHQVPDLMTKYMKYVRRLTNRIRPNYAMLKGLFLINQCLQQDQLFDWSHKHNYGRTHKSVGLKSSVNYRSLFQIQLTPGSNERIKYQPIHSSGQVVSECDVSSEEEQKLELQHSVLVGFSQSQEPESCNIKASDKQITPCRIMPLVSTLDFPYNYYEDIISFETQQQMLQSENQDLEIKYSLLQFKSVSFNYKNPILMNKTREKSTSIQLRKQN